MVPFLTQLCIYQESMVVVYVEGNDLYSDLVSLTPNKNVSIYTNLLFSHICIYLLLS